jgi:hypothetical protein
MKPGDLVRINLPERARELPSYYYHGYVGFVLRVTKHESQGLPSHSVAVLVDGMEREFSEKYLEVIDEAR